MKTKITILSALLLCAAIESKAQLADGSIAPDWTLSDINGVSHHMYADLNAGKTVYIDVSATWCGPCWAYHNGGALETLWTSHGPTGGTNVSSSTTNDAMVYFIEGDGSTGTNALHGINGVDGSTQGNWVTGVSHPIIDPPSSQINPFNSQYAIGYFPTIYMVCPDRSITEVGQVSATALYTAKSACAVAATGLDAQIMSSSTSVSPSSCDSVLTTVRLGNMGTTTLTAATITYKVDGVLQRTYNWTGNLNTYDNALVTGIKVGATTAGTHTITATVSNPNAGADVNAANDASTVTFVVSTSGTNPFVDGFENTSSLPSADWSSTHTGTGADWTVTTSSASTGAKSCMINNMANSAGNVTTLDNLHSYSLAAYNTPYLNFKLAYQQKNSTSNDRLQLYESINCGANWVLKWSKAGAALASMATPSSTPFVPTPADFVSASCNLISVAYKPSVMFRWVFTADASAPGNNLYIDDINISNSATGIENIESGINLSVYPNPSSSGKVNISFNLSEKHIVSVNVSDMLGRSVETITAKIAQAGETTLNLGNTYTYPAGIYVVSLNIDGQVITKKIVIE